MAKVLMLVAPERFRDEEYFIPREELEKSGHKVTLASSHKELCLGSRGGSIFPDCTIEDVDGNNFDALVIVGGGGVKRFFNDERVLALAKEMDEKKRIIGAICLAPVILANAGILKGKQATVAGTQAQILTEKGATYTGPGVTVDGRIVTANAPKSSQRFGMELVRLLDNI